MDWETFYDRFFDWSTSTQINRISSLKSFGASSEVAEVAQEFVDEKIASRFIRKAVAAGSAYIGFTISYLHACTSNSIFTLRR